MARKKFKSTLIEWSQAALMVFTMYAVLLTLLGVGIWIFGP